LSVLRSENCPTTDLKPCTPNTLCGVEVHIDLVDAPT
jgi:hypothetical protein